jgi:hypothetical protein
VREPQRRERDGDREPCRQSRTDASGQKASPISAMPIALPARLAGACS